MEKEQPLDPHVEDLSPKVSDNAVVHDWTPEEETAVKRKVDLRVFPMLCIIFGLSLLDRANMPFAYIAGMEEDLQLGVGARYSITLLVFFPSYWLFEIPSNWLVRRIGSRLWMSFLVIAWGLSVLGMGFVRNWNSLAACRAILGIFEAGLLPGGIFIVSSWYRPYEMAKRISGFWMTSQLCSAFGPILAYGLSLIEVGDGMYARGWRWIFIVEGLITIVAGIATPFFLIEFPERARFLNDRQKHIAFERVRLASDDKEIKHPTVKETLVMLWDWKLALYSLQYFIAASSIYSLAYFAPIILRQGLHFSYVRAQLLSTPPTVFSVICSIIAAWVSDKIKLRWPIMCFQALLAIAGLLIILYTGPPAVRYFGLFVASYGIQSNVPSVLSYVPNQTGRLEKKGVASAAVISAGAIGGICGSTVFRSQDSPEYFPGMWTTIGLQFVFIAITFALSMYFRRMNRLADEGKVRNLEGVDGFRYAP
ncbi:hypothetical protein M409DRAFT_70679 [Zasmidium cellare ATCC 36951]|uniref:Major facilitator superfamily (MFS) profile domain-containing protein n=1 Tax=Zasmidium cellare ATCC 36951 TaxID=1080233 RepID=A0A6A6C2T1_ZASCE|nr:uncharacterized protein M409DRAFT_70679 [Zasmidium cellare ATCC 36951]KAF2160172.1 hypothetical protein M409DRAFT_70679 [Zasmidium cellare ATCC 36951]